MIFPLIRILNTKFPVECGDKMSVETKKNNEWKSFLMWIFMIIIIKMKLVVVAVFIYIFFLSIVTHNKSDFCSLAAHILFSNEFKLPQIMTSWHFAASFWFAFFLSHKFAHFNNVVIRAHFHRTMKWMNWLKIKVTHFNYILTTIVIASHYS